MKHSLLIFVLMFFVSSLIMAQTHPNRSPQHVKQSADLNAVQSVPADAWAKFVSYRPEPGMAVKTESTLGTRYSPTQAMINTSERRITYTHDAAGNILTMLMEDFDGIGGTYVPVERYTSTYDNDNRVLTSTGEEYQSGAWVFTTRQTYTYDANGNTLTDEQERWNNGAWEGYIRITFTYNQFGLRATSLMDMYLAGSWQPRFRDTFVYDSQMNMISSLNEQFILTWTNSARVTYTYNAQSFMILQLSEMWNNGWQNQHRASYTHYSNGLIHTLISENWNNGAWEYYFKNTLTYTPSQMLATELMERWDNGAWALHERFTHTYDGQDNNTSELFEHYVNGGWENVSQQNYQYDQHGNATFGEYMMWENGNWVAADGYMLISYNHGWDWMYIDGKNVLVSYSSFTGIDEGTQPEGFTLYQNYPNPFNPSTTISYQLPKQSMVQLDVYNALGELIGTLVNGVQDAGDYTLSWDASRFGSGVYFLRLEADTYVSVRKMQLLK